VQNERQTGDDTSRDNPYGAYRTQAFPSYQNNATPVSPTGTPSNQAEDEDDEKGGILSDFSMSAVIASALAAATSFALSSKIGMAGSVIGVGVAAAASAIATQVYKGMLSASAKKIKNLANSSDDDLTQPMSGQVDRSDAGTTTVRPAATELTRDLTQPLSQAGVAETGTPIAPESLRERASKRHSKKVARGTVAVLAAVSIVAVLVYAAIVSVATQGKGIGTTTTQTATVTDEDATDQATGDQGNDAPSKPDDTKAKQDEKGSGSSTTNNGSSSGNSGSSSTDNSGSSSTTTDNSGSGNSSSTTTTDNSGSSGNSGSSSTDNSGSSSTTTDNSGSGNSSSTTTDNGNGSSTNSSGSSSGTSGSTGSTSTTTSTTSGN
jgi:hypothetical protein